MDRRQLLKSMGAMGLGALLAPTALQTLAASSNGPVQVTNFKALFKQALAQHPQLIGFTNVETDFAPQRLQIEGRIPADINGTFMRNGPGKHERGEQRYQHLFEGDGMLQQFVIANGAITHQGRFIQTPKFVKEQQAERFLYSGPDTRINNPLPVSSADTINTANTNVIAVGDDLWALWEGGSATIVDRDSLAFKQQVNLGDGNSYGNSLKGMPFSAHPKVEANGDIWNFGLSPTGHVILYHLNAKGGLRKVSMLNANYRGGMLHDFLITQHHLLVILPSLKTQPRQHAKQGFFNNIGFDETQPMRVLVVDKNDFALKQEFELAPGFAFHYGNAWEDSSGSIRFDASLYPDIDVLHKLGTVMRGDMDHVNARARTAFFTLHKDGSTEQHVFDTNNEFPRVMNHQVGVKNTKLFHLSAQNESLWSDTVCAMNPDNGNLDSYKFGSDYLVEEHVNVNPNRKADNGYLIGTALHVPSKRTCLNIFAANDVSAGPLARAWLPHHLPLGFHGNFIPA